MKVEAIEYEEKAIYHSPETPGYTSWCTLWRTLDGELRLAFQQITGPVDKPDLRQNNTVIIGSADEAKSWQVEKEIPARAQVVPRPTGIYVCPEDSAYCGHGLAVLPDGTLVAGLWAGGEMKTGFIQRSQDDGNTWSAPIYFMDPDKYKAYPTVIRRLHDGRLVLFAGVWDRDCGEEEPRTLIKMMFISMDDGKTWGEPITIMSAAEGLCEESDFCELPNGDLFWIHRAEHYPATWVEVPPLAARMGEPVPNGYSDRKQGIMRKQGNTWKIEAPVSAPFPHGGFPEVLLTSEGIILNFADEAIWWTADLGENWEPLSIPRSSYYPRATQLPDGTILVIGHDGSDDPYGKVDQYIRQQTFRLKVTK